MKSNPVWDFTVIFVRDFLGETSFDSRKHSRYLREMKRFINPDNDDAPIEGNDVIGCLRAMKSGLFNFDGEINSIWCITYGEPAYLQQYFQWKNEPPPFYNVSAVRMWEELTGQTAFPATPKSAIMFVPSMPPI